MMFFLNLKMPFSLSLLLTVDTSPWPIQQASESERTFQLALLQMFFANITQEGRESLSAYCKKPENYLQWSGVFCLHGFVSQVSYRKANIGNFNIHSLPHSTKRISVPFCHQKYPLQTRMLPKMLKELAIYGNEIFGTIDLTNLPEYLEEILAFNNNICGPVDLTKLPKELLRMNFTFNNIDQKVVLYKNLPPNLENIWLACQKKVENGTQYAQAFSEDDKLSDESAIFSGLKHLKPYTEN